MSQLNPSVITEGSLPSSHAPVPVPSSSNEIPKPVVIEHAGNTTLEVQSQTPPTRSKSARGNSRRHRGSRTSYRSLGGGMGSDDEEEEEGETGGQRRRGSQRRHRTDQEDSDDEVVRLCNSRGSKLLDPLGRDQPYPAMVNREMLCSLVRRSFHQTEEQQIQYEQILRHENGRKSKGEVSGCGLCVVDILGVVCCDSGYVCGCHGYIVGVVCAGNQLSGCGMCMCC